MEITPEAFKVLQDRVAFLSEELAKRDIKDKRTTPFELSPPGKSLATLSVLPDQVEKSE